MCRTAPTVVFALNTLLIANTPVAASFDRFWKRQLFSSFLPFKALPKGDNTFNTNKSGYWPSARFDKKNCYNNVSCEFDEFRVDSDLCKLRSTSIARF